MIWGERGREGRKGERETERQTERDIYIIEMGPLGSSASFYIQYICRWIDREKEMRFSS